MVILDPTYKILGSADENNATDISAMLNGIESLAVSTGAAVAVAGHFAKGNPSAKETIDRISGSGVFARDPDSLVVFTRHEEEGTGRSQAGTALDHRWRTQQATENQARRVRARA